MASIQLIDAKQDNSRPGNWFAESHPAIYTPEISTPAMQDNSRRQLRETKNRYEEMHGALKSAAGSMEPVLRQFKDYVLALKHNLNASAIASLKGEATTIQADISKLISQMNQSIAQADSFIKTLQ